MKDWKPFSGETKKDQRTVYDKMREYCPVAYSREQGWSVFRHEDVMRILNDPETFSNKVSAHLSVPNGMDPHEHTQYRRIIEQYFEKDRISRFEPICSKIAANLVDTIKVSPNAEFIDAFARTFSVQIQCAFLGWSTEMHEPLREWTLQNIEAIRNRDRTAIKQIAGTFNNQMRSLLEKRRTTDVDPSDDLTVHLMNRSVNGRLFTEEEIISILRNWTMGEVGTITNAIGILAHFIAMHTEVQTKLRSGDLPPGDVIEEILRLHDPLVTNRRKTTCPVKLGGRSIESGEQVTINWMSANRDRAAFPEPYKFKPDRNQDKNLLYGAGIHKCPAAPLARMELRVVLEELFNRTTHITMSTDNKSIIADYPESGYARLYLNIQ